MEIHSYGSQLLHNVLQMGDFTKKEGFNNLNAAASFSVGGLLVPRHPNSQYSVKITHTTHLREIHIMVGS